MAAIYQNKPLSPVSFFNCRNGLLRDENKEIEFTESKKSKMSDDEEKLIECRSRILEEASRHKDTADESNDEKNEADESGESEIFSMSPGKNAAEIETRERLEILESKVNQIMNRIDFTDRKKEEKSGKESERKRV